MFSKVVAVIISPLGTALLLGFAAIVLGWLGRKRSSIFCATLSLVWLVLWSLPIVSDTAIQFVESRESPVPIHQLPDASAIVILGGGMTGTSWPSDIGQPADLGNAADRVWHGARLFHAGKAPIIIVSGGQFFGVGTPEAKAMKLFLLDLGVPPSAIVQEQRSRTTEENAYYTAELLREWEQRDILLVTSATHMKRARLYFEAQGLLVVPAATDYKSARITSSYCCLPNADALNESGLVFKELLGWVWLAALDMFP